MGGVRGLHQCRQIRRRDALTVLFDPGEVFDIPLRTADGSKIHPAQAKARLARVGDKILQHLAVDGAVANDALFPDLVPARFKLRFDKADHVSMGL